MSAYRDSLPPEQLSAFDAACHDARAGISPELRAELRAKAEAAVATWPPLTPEQLAELRRILDPALDVRRLRGSRTPPPAGC